MYWFWGLLGGGLVIKALQDIFDEEYEGRYLPPAVRRRLIDAAWDAFGGRCPKCDKRVRKGDLTVDHIIPYSKDGKTSVNNSEVMCGPCNSSKGDRYGLSETLRGLKR